MSSNKSTMTQVPKEVYFLTKLCARNVKKPLIIISSSKNPSLISVIPFIETRNVAVMAIIMYIESAILETVLELINEGNPLFPSRLYESVKVALKVFQIIS